MHLLLGALAALGLVLWLVPRAMGYAAFWAWQVRGLEARNRAHPPTPGGIVFTGSSTIRFWSTLDRDMAPLPVSNQGFGGAHLDHVILYAPRIVLPSAPRIVVLYAGDNDLARGRKTPESVAADFADFIALVHAHLPETVIFFLSMKPSLRRRARWPRMAEANRLIERRCAEDPLLEYVDVATPMLDAEGGPRRELFRRDRLHLSPDGYALWTALLRPRLSSAWERREGAA